MNKLNILTAYPYLKDEAIEILIRNKSKINFLLDSGAFTAWKAGNKINLNEYIGFIKSLKIKPWGYFNLDVIGDGHASYVNYKKMLDADLRPIPIFTRGEDIKMVDAYYETSDVLAIGGLVGTRGNKGYVKSLMKIINGRKVHWLGFTDKEFIKYFKPYSCDSSSVTMAGRYGQFELFDRVRGLWFKCNKKDFASKPNQQICTLLESYNILPKELSSRDKWHGVSLSEQISFQSHIRASIEYKKRLNVSYFIALARVPFDLELSIKMFDKELFL